MAKTVTKADSEVMEVMIDMLTQHHRDLLEVEVKIGVVMVSNPDGPAVTHAGAAALAKVRKLNERDRLLTGYDAIIEVDALEYGELSPSRRSALFDHELTHLEIARGTRSGHVKYNADGRPKLQMRPDDWTLTGFADVVERHGTEANEACAIHSLVQKQMMFPFSLKERRAS